MQDDPNSPPDSAQQFSATPPSPMPTVFNSLPEGARTFAREYLPTDDDSGAIGTFETVKELKAFKTRLRQDAEIAKGREPGPECEVYEDEVYVRIAIRGNPNSVVHRRARDEDKKRFPFAWQEFKRGQTSLDRGTPLSKLPGIDAGIVLKCNAHNIFTVEDLSLVSDNWLPNIGAGARELRRQAIEFVNGQKPKDQGDQMAKVMEMLNKLAAENEALKQQMAKRGPGRPPKERIE